MLALGCGGSTSDEAQPQDWGCEVGNCPWGDGDEGSPRPCPDTSRRDVGQVALAIAAAPPALTTHPVADPTGVNPAASTPASRSLEDYCGDSVLSPWETCDDGNAEPGDGCNSICAREVGYDCPPTGACVYVVLCGDEILEAPEQCDDANANSGDGCSETCGVEVGYRCRTEGRACEPICGDSLLRGWEQCDDGNAIAGDGCGANCLLELGRQCPLSPGLGTDAGPNDGDSSAAAVESSSRSQCNAICGDAVVGGTETCDDGDANGSGHGYCTSECRFGAFCGDGQVEAPLEECDDGANVTLYALEAGGCAPGCVGSSSCGDGVTDAAFGERCDDGNSTAGDGCESCQLAELAGEPSEQSAPSPPTGEVAAPAPSSALHPEPVETSTNPCE
jgi:cysteine-rich repeat protein